MRFTAFNSDGTIKHQSNAKRANLNSRKKASFKAKWGESRNILIGKMSPPKQEHKSVARDYKKYDAPIIDLQDSFEGKLQIISSDIRSLWSPRRIFLPFGDADIIVIDESKQSWIYRDPERNLVLTEEVYPKIQRKRPCNAWNNWSGKRKQQHEPLKKEATPEKAQDDEGHITCPFQLPQLFSFIPGENILGDRPLHPFRFGNCNEFYKFSSNYLGVNLSISGGSGPFEKSLNRAQTPGSASDDVFEPPGSDEIYLYQSQKSEFDSDVFLTPASLPDARYLDLSLSFHRKTKTGWADWSEEEEQEDDLTEQQTDESAQNRTTPKKGWNKQELAPSCASCLDINNYPSLTSHCAYTTLGSNENCWAKREYTASGNADLDSNNNGCMEPIVTTNSAKVINKSLTDFGCQKLPSIQANQLSPNLASKLIQKKGKDKDVCSYYEVNLDKENIDSIAGPSRKGNSHSMLPSDIDQKRNRRDWKQRRMGEKYRYSSQGSSSSASQSPSSTEQRVGKADKKVKEKTVSVKVQPVHYKIHPCVNYPEGNCFYGDHCTFKH